MIQYYSLCKRACCGFDFHSLLWQQSGVDFHHLSYYRKLYGAWGTKCLNPHFLRRFCYIQDTESSYSRRYMGSQCLWMLIVKLIFLLLYRLYEKYVCKRVPGKQAVLVLQVDNTHVDEHMMVEPGLVMIFAHGIE